MTTDEKLDFLKSLLPEKTECIFAESVSDGFVRSDSGYLFSELPPFYRIRFFARPVKDSDLRIEVWLPDNWNGRLVCTGSGGIGGFIATDALAHSVRSGYAVANTDLGTSSGITCGFDSDEPKIDYAWRGTHQMALLAKQLVTDFYGKAPAYSYFIGASTGGMQAYMEAQRFPEDFDGIYAEVPSILNAAFHTNYLWAWRQLHKEDGSVLFTPEERALIAGHACDFFREQGDGEPGDPFVSYPYYGETTIPDFMAYLKKQPTGFTEEQLARLRKIYEGPYDPKRDLQISCGMPIGSERYWDGYAGKDCPGIYPFVWAFGPTFDPLGFDFSDDFQIFNQKMSKYINATSPDLNAFHKKDGKMLTSVGTADPVVLYHELNIYYEKVTECCGGIDKTMDFFRFYDLPGRNHGHGFGADVISAEPKNSSGAFDALVRWVEKGEAPYRLYAISEENPDFKGKIAFAREIYPYGSPEFPFMPHQKTYSDKLKTIE